MSEELSEQEIMLLRNQKRAGNALAREVIERRGVTLHPRVLTHKLAETPLWVAVYVYGKKRGEVCSIDGRAYVFTSESAAREWIIGRGQLDILCVRIAPPR